MRLSRGRALLGQVGPRDIEEELARRGIYVETVAVPPALTAPTLPGRPPAAPRDQVVVVAAEPGAFPRPAYMPVYPPLPEPTEAEQFPLVAGEPVAAGEKPFPTGLVVAVIALGAMAIFAERAPVRTRRRRPVRTRIVAEEYGPEEEGEDFYEN